MSTDGYQKRDTGCGEAQLSFDAGFNSSARAHNAFIDELAGDCQRSRGRTDFSARTSFQTRGQLDLFNLVPELHMMIEGAVRRHEQFMQSHAYLQNQHGHCPPERSSHPPHHARNGHSMSFSQSTSFEQHGNLPPVIHRSTSYQERPLRNPNRVPSYYNGVIDEPDDYSPPRPENYRPSIVPTSYEPQRGPQELYRPADLRNGNDLNSCTSAGDKVVASANKEVGQSMWSQSPYAACTENGKLGCAASVSEVLKRAGYSYANSAGVQELAGQLEAHGWKKINVADHPELVRPGDVVFGVDKQPGKSAHIGIIGECENGEIWQYDNNSANGKWSHCKLDESALNVKGNQRFGKQMWVMRPPDQEDFQQAQQRAVSV